MLQILSIPLERKKLFYKKKLFLFYKEHIFGFTTG